MCMICEAFRPYDDGCVYKDLEDGVGAAPVDPGGTDPITGSTGGVTPEGASVTEGSDVAGSTATTASMEVGDVFYGTLETTTDTDWVAIELEAGVTYTIDLQGVGVDDQLDDPYLYLRDSSGAVLVDNDDRATGAQDSRVTFTATTTGTYYVEANNWNNSDAGDYSIGVYTDSADVSLELMTDYLVNGYWAESGRDAHRFDITNTDAQGRVIINVDITALTADGQQLARWAFEAWEAVANVDFVEVTSGADITFDDTDVNSAYASYTATGGTTTSAQVNVGTGWLSNYGTTIGSYSLQTYIHEIGHALGLGHQGGYNGSATYGVDETFRNDSWSASIMSYFDQTDNTTDPAQYARLVTTMMADIAATQMLYGAAGSASATAGSTTWGYNDTLGNYMGTLFDAMINGVGTSNYNGGPIAMTIYDVGGTDTIDLTGETTGVTLDLTPGATSTVWGLRGSSGATPAGNLTIDVNTTIERAFGGSGDDQITGNDVANRLDGNDGADTLIGGLGNDNLRGGKGQDLMQGEEGDDVLLGGKSKDRLEGGADGDSLNGGYGKDNLLGGKGNDTLEGGGNNDKLTGGKGHDTLEGGEGDDRMWGGGGDDTFVFSDGFGVDTIYDFEATNDLEKIDLSGVTAITDFADLSTNHMAQVGLDVVISAGGDTILLEGVNLADLDAADFIF